MKPTGDYRIDLGSRNEMRRSEAEGRSPKAIAKRRASARAGHRRIACPESSARELGRPRGNAPKSGARREPSAQAEPEGRASGCAKAKRGVGRGHSSGEAGNDRGYPPSDRESRSDALAGVRRASACKRDDANQMARTIMSKDCNRGQSAMWRRVGNRSSIWRSIHRNQCETEPRGEGERN